MLTNVFLCSKILIDTYVTDAPDGMAVTQRVVRAEYHWTSNNKEWQIFERDRFRSFQELMT